MRVLRIVLPVLLLLALVPMPGQGQGATVAVMVRASGGVQVQPNARARAVAAAPGMQLAAGARVVVPAGGRAVLLYRTGRSETLTRTATVQAPRRGNRPGLFRQTLRTLGEVASTDARAQPNRQGMIRPLAGAAVPAEPRNGAAILALRPTFVWLSVPGAAGYQLQLRDSAAGVIRRWTVGMDTAWTLADSAAALEPGGVYHWSVAAGEDGRAAPPQRFRVATQAERDSLETRMRELREAGLDPEGDGLFLAALTYQELGFLYDARAALDRLAARGDRAGRDVHLLRAEVYDALGMLDAAARELALAETAGESH